jgi:hypothetical protein
MLSMSLKARIFRIFLNYAIFEESFCSSDWRSVNWESAKGRAALSTTWPSYPPSTPRPSPRSPSPAESGAGQVQHIPSGLGLARYSTSPEHWSGAGQVQHIPRTLVLGWPGTAHPLNTGLGLARYSTSPVKSGFRIRIRMNPH